MKRFVCILLILVLTASALAACAPSGGSSAESSAPESSKTESSVPDASVEESFQSDISTVDNSEVSRPAETEPVEIKTGKLDLSKTTYCSGSLKGLCWLDDTNLIIGAMTNDTVTMNITIYNIVTGEEILLGQDKFSGERMSLIGETFDCDGEYLYYSHDDWSLRRIRLIDGEVETAEPHADMKDHTFYVEGTWRGKLLYCKQEIDPEGSLVSRHWYWEDVFTGERSEQIEACAEKDLTEYLDGLDGDKTYYPGSDTVILLPGGKRILDFSFCRFYRQYDEHYYYEAWSTPPLPHDGSALFVRVYDPDGSIIFSEDFVAQGDISCNWSEDGEKLYFMVEESSYNSVVPDLRLRCCDLATGERTETSFEYVTTKWAYLNDNVDRQVVFSSDGSFYAFIMRSAENTFDLCRQYIGGEFAKCFTVWDEYGYNGPAYINLSPNEQNMAIMFAYRDKPASPVAMLVNVADEGEPAVSSVDAQAEEYCEKYVTPWCRGCPFIFDFDYRDASSPQDPELFDGEVDWLFANCWYLSHGESPTYDGAPTVFQPDIVENTIGVYFPFPTRLLRNDAMGGGINNYYKGVYPFEGVFEYRNTYAVVNEYGHDEESGLLVLKCSLYPAGTNHQLLGFTLWIEEHPDGSWRYLANHVE